MIRRLLRAGYLPAFVLATTFVISACSEDPVSEPTTNVVAKHDAAVAADWYELQLELVQKSPGFSPPVASRAFGYTGVTLYEALVPGMPDRKSLAGQLNELTVGMVPSVEAGAEYHWPTVANAALAQINRSLFGNATDEMKAKINALEEQYTTQFLGEVDGPVVNRSVAYGKAVADAIFEWSKTDGGHEGYTKNFPATYVPPTGDGMWVPTPRVGGAPQSALQPYWGQNRPFILTKGNPNSDSEPGAPPAYSTDPSSPFYQEANEVYTTITNLTAEQRAIATFWADDPGKTCTPPGHSISILTQCAQLENKKLDFAAVAYAQVGIAVSDAFLACWESKFKYNLLRPITYITTIIDQGYDYNNLPLNTPPFPEYPSGHSVQSGASAAVLASLFGQNFSFTDNTHQALGYPARTFTSFDAAANEAAISRLYGGIHYRAAIENGVEQGKKIGQQVLTKIDWTK